MAKKLVKFPNQCQQMKFCNKQNASKICKTLILRKNVIIEKERKRGSSFILRLSKLLRNTILEVRAS